MGAIKQWTSWPSIRIHERTNHRSQTLSTGPFTDQEGQQAPTCLSSWRFLPFFRYPAAYFVTSNASRNFEELIVLLGYVSSAWLFCLIFPRTYQAWGAQELLRIQQLDGSPCFGALSVCLNRKKVSKVTGSIDAGECAIERVGAMRGKLYSCRKENYTFTYSS